MAASQRRDRQALILICLCGVGLAAGFVYDHNRLLELELRLSRIEGPSSRKATQIDISGAALKGSRSAPAALVVYSDFQCPYCRGFAQTTLDVIERRYVATGNLLVVFKHFPLERLHSSAIRAAEATSCANKQGHFWALHDRIFSGQEIPDAAGLAKFAAAVGIEPMKFSDCLANHRDLLQIQRDGQEARSLGFSGTPAFVLGPMVGSTVTVAVRIRGSRPQKDFTSAIDQVLGRLN